jgi:hypothetical protein
MSANCKHFGQHIADRKNFVGLGSNFFLLAEFSAVYQDIHITQLRVDKQMKEVGKLSKTEHRLI